MYIQPRFANYGSLSIFSWPVHHLYFSELDVFDEVEEKFMSREGARIYRRTKREPPDSDGVLAHYNLINFQLSLSGGSSICRQVRPSKFCRSG